MYLTNFVSYLNLLEAFSHLFPLWFLWNFLYHQQTGRWMTTISGMSLIYITKSIGPRTLPCGIPLVTWWHLDSVSFTITFCILLLRKLSTHLITFSLILYLCILCRSLLCGTLSKAFIKSIYTESIFPPLSIILVHSSITLRSCRVVDIPEMKPNCLLHKSLLADLCFTIVSLTSFSMVLQITLVRLTGL